MVNLIPVVLGDVPALLGKIQLKPWSPNLHFNSKNCHLQYLHTEIKKVRRLLQFKHVRWKIMSSQNIGCLQNGDMSSNQASLFVVTIIWGATLILGWRNYLRQWIHRLWHHLLKVRTLCARLNLETNLFDDILRTCIDRTTYFAILRFYHEACSIDSAST